MRIRSESSAARRFLRPRRSPDLSWPHRPFPSPAKNRSEKGTGLLKSRGRHFVFKAHPRVLSPFRTGSQQQPIPDSKRFKRLSLPFLTAGGLGHRRRPIPLRTCRGRSHVTPGEVVSVVGEVT